jgi:hypothetical protein
VQQRGRVSQWRIVLLLVILLLVFVNEYEGYRLIGGFQEHGRSVKVFCTSGRDCSSEMTWVTEQEQMIDTLLHTTNIKQLYFMHRVMERRVDNDTIRAIGRYYPDSEIIFVQVNYPRESMAEILCHEIGHAVLHAQCGDDLDEQLDEAFAEYWEDRELCLFARNYQVEDCARYHNQQGAAGISVYGG